MPSKEEKTAPPPPPREPPAFGARLVEDEGLATGLGVAQPTETDRPELPADEPKP